MKKADRTKKGMIFNIQKFSVNDGPGIRTVVFFKGCPLHCAWCANPESQYSEMQVLWNMEKCVRCHHCVETRPEKAMELAVAGMLPHNTLGRKALKKLRIYRDADHKHEAQTPVVWEQA